MCPFRNCSRHMQQIPGQYWKIVGFFTPDKCSVFVSGMYGVRVRICTAILCVLTPVLSLPCSAKWRRAGARKSKTGLRWPCMGVECAVQGGCRGGGAAGRPSDAPRSGGWVRGAREARGERGRVGSTKAVVGQQVLGRGDEISSGRPKMLLFSTSSCCVWAFGG
jgi:hypothetical protein